ncbi:uncharacterized protein LOC121388333 isoform X1 [Gigantopelta aegis]|uniref:uncharacterized protein LOC121388333 isoform X1 n=1 Tax=Gigantopelta aegis TaxID=1735272 RepID=UPI001B88B414|nr:uncharacterized protein LOC121388333 isoform X1 [Gigantopelta aegis]
MGKFTEFVIFGCLALLAANLTTATWYQSSEQEEEVVDFVMTNCYGIMFTTWRVCISGHRAACLSLINIAMFCTHQYSSEDRLMLSFRPKYCMALDSAAKRFCIWRRGACWHLQQLLHFCHRTTTTTTPPTTTTPTTTTPTTTATTTTQATTTPQVCTAPNTCLKPDCDPANLRPQYTCANNNVCCEIRRIRGVVKTSRP